MRVEIVSEIASLKGAFLPSRSESFQRVSESQVLTNFRAALNGEGSFFRLQDSIAGFPGQSGGMQGACAGQFVIAFRRLDLSGDRSLYSILLQTLQELLNKASSSDALFATLCVTAPATRDGRAPELSLVLQLEAIGSTPEQAELRWGLGLMHVQEALLSASRLLREHLAKTSLHPDKAY
jgi:hypothetical protein